MFETNLQGVPLGTVGIVFAGISEPTFFNFGNV